MQTQERLKYIKQLTLFYYSIFVIYKTLLDDTKHDRLVVNIKRLNQVFIRDTYSLSSQSEIIALISEYVYVTYINEVLFFY